MVRALAALALLTLTAGAAPDGAASGHRVLAVYAVVSPAPPGLVPRRDIGRAPDRKGKQG